MANRDPGNSGWNMDPIGGFKSDHEGVDASDWDPSDPTKKKLKPHRKFSFEHPSIKK
jgi:hypothetical protein